MFLARRHANSSDELTKLQNEMNRMIDGVFGPAVSFWPVSNRSTVPFPKLDVSETDSAIHISAELPGVKQDEIDVEIHADTMRVSGEKKDERVVNEHNFHAVERSFGRFDRTITLPAEVDSKQADATFKDGVLTISLPKLKPVAAHKIAVKGV
ncbi:MAG: Hsp20/alpha crystallin family protein [Planctomycetes bacterium]|nr:Hsp20/alpha crystallin family protein [Planctomycetota bacterium]